MKIITILVLISNCINSYALTTVSLTSTGHVETAKLQLKKIKSNSTSSFKGILASTEKMLFSDYRRTRVFNSSNFDHRVIGQIESLCTATLVSNKHILTAAHCVYNTTNKTWINKNSFSAGQLSDELRPYGTTNWKKVYILEEFIKTGDTIYDFAIIELDSPLGNLIGWKAFGFNNNLQDGVFGEISGYPGDRPNGTPWKVKCPLTFLDKEVTHMCDTFGGMSGSSIRVKNYRNEDVIIGIHIYGGTQYNGGARIDSQTYRVLSSWINDSRVNGDSTNSRN